MKTKKQPQQEVSEPKDCFSYDYFGIPIAGAYQNKNTGGYFVQFENDEYLKKIGLSNPLHISLDLTYKKNKDDPFIWPLTPEQLAFIYTLIVEIEHSFMIFE